MGTYQVTSGGFSAMSSAFTPESSKYLAPKMKAQSGAWASSNGDYNARDGSVENTKKYDSSFMPDKLAITYINLQ
jgi:hypothetical protein